MAHEEEPKPVEPSELTPEENLRSSLQGYATDAHVPTDATETFVDLSMGIIDHAGETDEERRANIREELRDRLGQLADRRGLTGEHREGFINDVFVRIDSFNEKTERKTLIPGRPEYYEAAMSEAEVEELSDGTFVASIPEFIGATANESTPEAARERLGKVVNAWLHAREELGYSQPEIEQFFDKETGEVRHVIHPYERPAQSEQ